MSGAPHADRLLVLALRAAVDDALAGLVPRGGRVALLDFPTYPNVGDSAIWLGELAWLAGLGARVALTGGHEVTARELRALPRDTTILLSGGGNFGDLWEAHQRFREAVVAACPDRRVVQLPQSIAFTGEASLARARAALGNHPELHLCLRDRPSYALAAQHFPRARLRLCPDMAFRLGPLARPRGAPAADVVWLGRGDHEGAVEAVTPSARDPRAPPRVDWVDEPPSRLADVHRWLLAQRSSAPRLARALAAPHRHVERHLASARLARGAALLASGRRVVTDRLHGHVLCILLGIPHVVLPDRFGKIRGLYEAWTSGSSLATWCDAPADALAAAWPR